MRFALLEAKIGMYNILSKYDLKVCDRTPLKVTLDPKSILSNPLEALWIKVAERKQ